MNVVDILVTTARAKPDQAAIIDTCRGTSRVTTYGELDRWSQEAAGLFHSKGIGAGDAMLVLCPMCTELYAALLALFRIGAIGMFIDPSFDRHSIEACCSTFPPKGFFATARGHLLRLVSPGIRGIRARFSPERGVPGASPLGSLSTPFTGVHATADNAPALLTFTSGSTDLPKAAMRTHGFLLAQHKALADTMRLRPGELNLTALPIVVLSNLASGVTSLLPNTGARRPERIDPAPVCSQIREDGPNAITASPTFLSRIADHCAKRTSTLTGVRRILCGGGPIFPAMQEKLRALAPQAEIVAVYGTTEAEPIAAIDLCEQTAEDTGKMRSGGGLLAGAPAVTLDLRIIRNHWGRTLPRLSTAEFSNECLPVGESGEIVVSGNHVLKSYLDGRGDHETKFAVGGQIWHRTGDAGYVDKQGRLWLLGRCTAAACDTRGVLYPFPVECAAQQCPGVSRAAFVALPERRVLVIEPRDNPRSFDTAGVAKALSWALLDAIVVYRRIPLDKRHGAKVDYASLTRQLEGKELVSPPGTDPRETWGASQ